MTSPKAPIEKAAPSQKLLCLAVCQRCSAKVQEKRIVKTIPAAKEGRYPKPFGMEGFHVEQAGGDLKLLRLGSDMMESIWIPRVADVRAGSNGVMDG